MDTLARQRFADLHPSSLRPNYPSPTKKLSIFLTQGPIPYGNILSWYKTTYFHTHLPSHGHSIGYLPNPQSYTLKTRAFSKCLLQPLPNSNKGYFTFPWTYMTYYKGKYHVQTNTFHFEERKHFPFISSHLSFLHQNHILCIGLFYPPLA